ncbi:MAG TPA: threonine/serine dehydratase [Candidatus Dormibacteraeota bacterium]|jgi:threonine dehydratase|nr:threonine/serine dehydratase [Candidatus Dormibacteraeota bacterium]
MRDRQPDSITLADVQEARKRIAGFVPRTPLIRVEDGGTGELYLKLENLQPIRSFKVRGSGNALACLDPADLASGVYTASAGNMAQGLAWNARRLGIKCTAVVPDGAPHTKLEAIHRLGAETVSVPYDDWWNVLVTHRYAPLEPAHFIHPVSDVDVMAGNGTIGLEILEDLPDVNAVLVPYGGGGLSCGIATAVRGLRPEVRVYGCEVDTAAPLAAAFAAGGPVPCPRIASFVDGIGSPAVLPEMWAPASRLLAGSLVVSLPEVAAAIRHLVQHAAIVAEGAGGASVAASLKGLAGPGRYVAIVSGGNIDPDVLGTILAGLVP